MALIAKPKTSNYRITSFKTTHISSRVYLLSHPVVFYGFDIHVPSQEIEIRIGADILSPGYPWIANVTTDNTIVAVMHPAPSDKSIDDTFNWVLEKLGYKLAESVKHTPLVNQRVVRKVLKSK